MDLKVLGIDPSLNNFGLVKATIDTVTLEVTVSELILAQPEKADKATKKVVRKNSDDLRRAQSLVKSLRAASDDCAIAIVECPVGSQSARAMASYGICVGVLASCSLPLIQVTPSEVKIVATGSKAASKDQMIAWAMGKHPDADWRMRKAKDRMVPKLDNEHLADAVAAIYAGIETDQFKQLMSLAGLEAA